MVKERETTWLSLPGASIAFTEKVWAPLVSDRVYGEEQVANGLESYRQTKVEPASLEAKEKVGVGSVVKLPPVGPPVMLATGGVVSAVTQYPRGAAEAAVGHVGGGGIRIAPQEPVDQLDVPGLAILQEHPVGADEQVALARFPFVLAE